MSLNVSSNITENTRQSIGPTGSGTTYEWSGMDFLPENAKVIVFNCNLRCANPTSSGEGYIQLRFFPFGETGINTESDIAVSNVVFSGASSDSFDQTFKIHVTLDSENRFNVEWDDLSSAGNSVSITMKIAEIHT
jgi:hypothetical protein